MDSARSSSVHKLRAILLVSFSGLLGLLLFSGLDGLGVLGRLHDEEQQARRAFLVRNATLTQLRAGLLEYWQALDRCIAQNGWDDPGRDQEFIRLFSAVEGALSHYPNDGPVEEQNLIELLHSALDQHQAVVRGFVGHSDLPALATGSIVLAGKVQILEISEEISRVNRRMLEESGYRLLARFDTLQGRLRTLLLVTLLSGLLLAAGSFLYIARLEREVDERSFELGQLSSRLVQAHEEERRSISRELHDEVGQSLGALLVDAGRLGSLVPEQDEQARGYVAHIKSVAERTLQSVRNIALLLRPSMLDDLGLVPALEWQAREVSRHGEMEVEVHADDLPDDLPDDQKTCIYRVVQEALNNAARHAAARQATVTLHYRDDKLELIVADDGRGFEPKTTRGMGILGMDERVKRLGGSLSIQSTPGNGTTLRAELPWRRPEGPAKPVD
ncbi:sensor histidine kinase [uncultured Paludibaculum sp.]|uniref:sensor histidine kinase n=1 Tax=uncultured Paludibaculum sp. TaxID=1765020 RepID=UPI002AAB5914|nr:sensor histidine kinase [uncultured Paludibaculum sp.]